MQTGGTPILVLSASTKKEEGNKAQLGNIMAARAVADVIRTCLGPRAMLKMVLDAMGGIVLTNDGNAILREIDVSHPAAKSMIDLSRTQDENIGDGTTSVIILAGEVLGSAAPWLEKKVHPRIIIGGFSKALEDGLAIMDQLAAKVDINNPQEMHKIVSTSIGTKFINRWANLFIDIAVDAVKTVYIEKDGKKEIDIKNFVRIEKLPGGEISESYVLKGVVLNKDITHAKMRRRIENPKILLLDCPLEYKKAESQLNVEITNEAQWSELLKIEEEYVMNLCNDIIKWKPDLVITEKGLSDLAQHFLVKNGITALRRARKTDTNRIARATGATIVHRPDEIQASDLGVAGLFEVRKIGDEYFSFIEDCKNAKACTVVLRGANKDVLNEVERNLNDAMNVVRNVLIDPRLVPGGGAIEMAVSQGLLNKAASIQGVEQWTYKSVALALEVIPRTLAENCGAKVVKLLTELRAKHASDPQKNFTFGVDGNKGTLVDMNTLGIWEPVSAKSQTLKTAIEAACLLLRVDAIVSGLGNKNKKQQQQPQMEGAEDAMEAD